MADNNDQIQFPSREQMLEDIKASQLPSREQMLADIQRTPTAISNASPAPEPSTMSDLEQGAEKGIGGDIIGGGIQSGMDVLQSLGHRLGLANASPTQVGEALKKLGVKGNIGPTNEKEMYRQAADEANKQYGAAQERSPIAFGAGELGGMGLGIMGGEGALSAAGVPTKLLQAPAGAGRLARLGIGAVNAAPAGAIIGGMQSPNNLINASPQDQSALLGDVGKGALTGSLVGAGVELAGQGLGALANKTGIGKRLQGMYKLGQEGQDLSSPTSQTGTLEQPESLDNSIALHDQRAAQSVLSGIDEASDVLGKNMDEAINNATQDGMKLKAGPEVTEQINQLFKNEAILPEDMATAEQETGAAAAEPSEASDEGDFQNNLFKSVFAYGKKFQDEGLSPVEMRDFVQKMYKIGRTINRTDPVVSSDVFEVAQNLNNTLKTNVPKYSQAAERFDQFHRGTSDTILSKNIPVDTSNIKVFRTPNADTKLLKNMTQIIKGLYNPNDKIAQGTFNNLLKGLQDFNASEMARKAQALQDNNPNFKTIFEQLGVDPQAVESFIRDKAYKSNLIQTYTGTPAIPMGGDISQAIRGIGKASDYLANKAGTFSRNNNPVLATGKKLYTASDDALRSLSDKLTDLPGQRPIADALSEAIKNKDVLAKNAILFSIMQNPNLRNMVDSDNLIVGD